MKAYNYYKVKAKDTFVNELGESIVDTSVNAENLGQDGHTISPYPILKLDWAGEFYPDETDMVGGYYIIKTEQVLTTGQYLDKLLESEVPQNIVEMAIRGESGEQNG